jgi:ribosomal protein S18 acetylase RimI-like enzyme
MNNFKIRQAHLKDLEEIVHVEEIAYRDLIITWTKTQFERYIKNPNALVYLGIKDNKIVGKAIGIIYQGKKNKSLQIKDLSILPEYRRFYIGQSLLLHLETKAKRLGCIYSALDVSEVNKKAIALYIKLSYYFIPAFDKRLRRMKKELKKGV